jgi:hypothetical protein
MVTRERVRAMTFAGITRENQAQILGIAKDTLLKYYQAELNTAIDGYIYALSSKATEMALDGSDKMLMFLLKTKGASHGFVEKQVIEHGISKELEALQTQALELEQKYTKEY